MNLQAWLKSRSWSAHSIAAAGIVVAAAITTDPTVRNFVLSLFQKYPIVGSDIVILAGIVFKYTPAHSPAGIVAEAKAVQAKPDAPTADQIAAATTK